MPPLRGFLTGCFLSALSIRGSHRIEAENGGYLENTCEERRQILLRSWHNTRLYYFITHDISQAAFLRTKSLKIASQQQELSREQGI
ncbi:hypothetical protein GDO81_006837 [Engystomops pustulosus]|uniref:Secreted protein n=1 Tax=Engystomops pustulosus TaxID=76066 RepID=A0AAV7CZR9_ENGPU|nr:hypothetical protein GDO81_006837 [Engystomops pustulosus]